VPWYVVQKGFYFTAVACELPVVWVGDGPHAVKSATLPWDRHPRVQTT
jgi:hypothetical protein